jgi:hypothetical protein
MKVLGYEKPKFPNLDFLGSEKALLFTSTSHLGQGLPLVGGGGFMVWARNC